MCVGVIITIFGGCEVDDSLVECVVDVMEAYGEGRDDGDDDEDRENYFENK